MTNQTRHDRWTPATLFRATVAALVATAWSALLLAGLGQFNFFLPLCAGALAAFIFLRHPVAGAASWSRWDLAAVALALTSLCFTLRPHLNLLGGWDPSVYLHTASALDRYGTLKFPESDLCQLAGESRALLTRDLHGIMEPFLGMRVYDGSFVTPQFYHLYPSLMAVLWPLGGLKAALLVNPLLNVLALLAIYATGRRLGGPAAGLLALVALLLHPAQIWQARFSSAEMLTQALLWSGFALLLRLDASSRRDALLAGLTLGAAQLARYDSLMVLAPLGLVLLMGILIRQPWKPLLLTLAGLAVMALHAWLHQRWVAPFYAPIPGVVRQAMLVLLAILGVLGLGSLHPRLRQVVDHLVRGPVLRVVGLVFFALWWIFVLFIRTHLAEGTALGEALAIRLDQLLPSRLAGGLSGQDAGIGYYLRALWSWPALLVAMAGTLWLLWRERGLHAAAWLAGCMAVSLVLTYRIYNDHFLMWLSRRYIPVVIPLFSIGLALGCAALVRRWGKDRFLIAAALLALLLAPRLPASHRMATLREWDGLDQWLEQVSDQIPAGARLISDQAGFAASLRYLHREEAFELNQRVPEAWPRLVRLLNSEAPADPLYLLTQRAPEQVIDAGFVKVADAPMKTGRLNHTRRKVPDDLKSRGGAFVLYRWTGSAPSPETGD